MMFKRLNIVVVVMAASVAAVGQVATLAFRQGVNGYTGMKDAYIDRSKPEYNNGLAADIWIHGQSDEFYPLRAGLVKITNIFGSDSNQVPFGQTIQNAVLRLYLRTDLIGGSTAKGVKADPLLVDILNYGTKDDTAAGAGELTWKDRGHGLFDWGPPINDGPIRDLDYSSNATVSVVYYASNVGGFVEIDITNIVSEWYDGTLNNYGLILRPSNDQTASLFRSSDCPEIEQRPELVIIYNVVACGDSLHPYPIGDFNKDCIVDSLDLSIFAANWLECTDIHSNCDNI